MTAQDIKRQALTIAAERNPKEGIPLAACAIAAELLKMPELVLHGRARRSLEEWIDGIRASAKGEREAPKTGSSMYKITVVNSLLNNGEEGHKALKIITARTPARRLKIGDVIRNNITGVADVIVSIDNGGIGIVVTFSNRCNNRVVYIGSDEVIDVYHP
ncbi:hypothetical protein MRQ47_004477 [Salmonella enterica]|nr:hypothetical protein [Salmonella enterica]